MTEQKIKRIISSIVMLIIIASSLLGVNVVRAFEEKALTDNNNEENSDIEIQQKIEKYLNISDNETLLQQKITIEQENLEKEYEKIETIAPTIENKKPKDAIVLFGDQKMEESYEYDNQNGLLKIETLHDQKLEEYKIIYTYEKTEDEEAKEIELSTKVFVKTVNQEEIQKEEQETIQVQKMGNVISMQLDNTKEIYKGYLYEGKENKTQYTQNANVEISSTKNIEEIRIENQEESYTFYQEGQRQAFSTNQSIYYIETKINKENMLKILGANGTITIKNGDDNTLCEITKTTEADEDGNITISYEGISVNNLIIVTSKPETEGTLKINNKKGILADTGYKKEEAEAFKYLEEKIAVNEAISDIKMNLLEPQTNIELEINKEELDIMAENKDVELRVILKSNNNSDKLFESPTIQIVLPEEVEAIDLQEIKLLYEEELKIDNVNQEGRKITINLTGKQTSYKEQSIEGAVITIKADLRLNKKATNVKKEIVATCIQDSNNIVEAKKEISLISPREIITVNSIQNLDIETVGEQKREEAELEVNAEAKEVEIKSEIINNQEAENENISIIGTFPTNSKNNNLGITITTPITVEQKQAKIYYTNKENVDENIENLDNGWTEEIDQNMDAKKYLIKIDNMQTKEVVDFYYNCLIPEDLDHNEQAEEGYKVLYTNSETQISNCVASTYINLTTGKGPIVEAEMMVKVGDEKIENGATVKAGEEITYEINLKNTGTEQAKNVSVSMSAPENTSFKNEQEGNTTIETIDVGETKVVSYKARVNDDLDSKIQITAKAKISYDGLEKETQEISTNIEPAKIVGELTWVTEGETMLVSGDMVEYGITITNNTDEMQDNLVLEWNLPEFCEIKLQSIKDETTGLDKTLLENNKNINLGSLEARKSIEIRLIVYIGNVEESKTVAISATVKQGEEIYRIGKTEERLVYCTTNYERKLTANNENEYIKPGEEINYTIKVVNKNDERIYKNEGQEHLINIKDTIPQALTILEVTVNGNKQELDENNPREIFITTSSNPGEETTVTIKTIVDYKDETTNETITNKAIVITSNGTELETNSVSHIIEREEKTDGGEENENGEGGDEQNKTEYKISGKVWVDENQDGEMGEKEELINGIKVTLMNIKTNEYATDKAGAIIEATTNEEGSYTLSNIPVGEYLVIFEYDSSRYTLTQYQKEGVNSSKNSKVVSKKIKVGNMEKIYGVTDIIKVTNRSIANINMGLVKTKEFDFKLDKYISRAIVQMQNSSNVYSYNNTKLAKLELDSKKLANINITVEYKIIVSNVGQLDGYAKKIVDYMPEGFNFNAQQNKNWYKQGENLYNVSLANEKIAVGESKEITLILTKNITQDEMGSYINNAEIAESYNGAGVTDINSMPANKIASENDMSQAELIVSIKTGKVMTYIMLIISSISIIAAGIYLIKKKVLDVKN